MRSERDVAISVRGLSKAYTIAHQQETQSTLAETLLQRIRHPFRRAGSETFWALREVSFDIAKGEVVGIIGRNGAGKSTLLKILSRITAPTLGEIDLFGRVGSLLEVGTGFHPELTGRENIFLNGAILGMTKAEIRRQFDAIVDFSGVATFLDTPVKRYSSGMYVRLAFAVAAHLESEILIVDEVLAVGDAEFQKRCLGKMKDVATGGRTVFFVSHNMQAISTLCDRAIWLKAGALVEQGAVATTVANYFRDINSTTQREVPLREKPRAGSGTARFTKLTITRAGADGVDPGLLVSGDDVEIELEIEAMGTVTESNVAITLYDFNGYRILDANTAMHGAFLTLPAAGAATVAFTLHSVLLKPGSYIVELWLGRAGLENIDFVRDAGVIQIHEDMAAARHSETFPGLFQCRFAHRIRRHER